MLNKSAFILLIIGVIVVIGCDSNRIYDEFQTVDEEWHKTDIKAFNFKAPDTTNGYHLFINIRNNNDYKYSNLFLIAQMTYPNGKTTTDTLEYRMANAQGELLGEGFTDVKENKLWYKGYDVPFIFTENGDYVVTLQHAMRENNQVKGVDRLTGILDIGISIEPIEQ